MCDLEVIGGPSIFKLIRKTEVLVRMLTWNWKSPLVVYYESIKREMKTTGLFIMKR